MNRIVVVAGIILRDRPERSSQVLLAKRSAKQHQGGLWEFPGGKVGVNEGYQSALSRELKEELDIIIEDATFFQQVLFDYSDKNIELNFYLVSSYLGMEKGMEGQPIKWVDIETLADYQFPEANQSVVNNLARGSLIIDSI